MRRAGTVERISQGLLVVRTTDERYPSLGEHLLDDRLERVGTVVDVFGPVDRPWLAVDPASDTDPPLLLGEPLYVR